MSKIERHLEIRNIIKENKVGSQEELMELLQLRGFKFTQATLSRDLKYLKAGKKSDAEKGMVYFLPDNEKFVSSDPAREVVSESGFISIEFTGNMAVIKTLPGFASSFAYKIDALNAYEILGTVAGDDTILVIGREGVHRQNILLSLRPVLPR